MIHITAMSMLIRSHPSVFQGSGQLQQDQSLGYGECPFTSEDLHRAFLLLKFHLRHRSAAKSDNSFYKSDETGQVKKTRYFTSEDLRAAVQAARSESANPEDVHPMEALARAEDNAPEEAEEDRRVFTQQEADFEKGVELLEELSTQEASEVDPERAGIKSVRQPLSRAAQLSLCQRLRAKVKVLHEEKWTELEPGEDAEVRSQTRVSDPHPLTPPPEYPPSGHRLHGGIRRHGRGLQECQSRSGFLETHERHQQCLGAYTRLPRCLYPAAPGPPGTSTHRGWGGRRDLEPLAGCGVAVGPCPGSRSPERRGGCRCLWNWEDDPDAERGRHVGGQHGGTGKVCAPGRRSSAPG